MTRRGFTLVEIITVMLIMSLAAVVVMPVVSVLLSRIEDSQGRRRSSALVHTAFDQLSQTIREWPTENGVLVGLDVYRESGEIVGLEISGFGGFELINDDLNIISSEGVRGLLCPGVELFEIEAIGPDSPDTFTMDEELTQGVTFQLELMASGVRVAGTVYVRSMGGAGS